jgi:phosphatidylglycerophosphate synthase
MEKNKRRFITSVYFQDLIAIPLATLLIKKQVNANTVTMAGLISACISGILYLNQLYVIGAFLFIVALILDSTDGRVARGTNTFSDFGAKLDSVADKVRSFLVAFCFLWSLNLSVFTTILFFGFYIALPLIRFLMARNSNDFYDPTIMFWDSMPFKNWFVKHGILGFYTGWERAVVALVIAPIIVYKIELFILAVLLEQLIFVIGLCVPKKYKIGI